MTPKQKVQKRHPRAYALRYGDLKVTWFVYLEPAKIEPRGMEVAAVVLGKGASARHAWADAQARTTTPNAKAVRPAVGGSEPAQG